MSIKGNPGDGIQEILILNKPQDIRLLFSEKYNAILRLVSECELSISDIARSLDINPGSIHYHLKELEKHGLVKQVREEVKGGIVKKYYRSSAKRILFDSPSVKNAGQKETFTDEEFIWRFIRSIEYLGYHLPAENREAAEELLLRYDGRIREILRGLEGTGLETVDNGRFMLQNSLRLVLNIRAKDDPELGSIYREFDKLFVKYE
jgi:DNA-binding transcriptional ArsR family regulator